jgi:glycerol kinase
VEFDAAAVGNAALDVARASLAAHGRVEAVGIANQRASTIVWDAVTGEPVAPAIGWQDLRTVGECLGLGLEGFRVAPNLSVTKLAHILDSVEGARSRDLRFGTVDTWMVWLLTQGQCHVTDATNFAVTGLTGGDGVSLHSELLERLQIDPALLPTVVDSSGVVGQATALDGAPPIAGIAGDQQASLVGQGAVEPGQAKITFGTGGMLDVVVGPDRPGFETRGEGGTFPIVARRLGGEVTWGLEAVMLTAGTEVEWLVSDLGLIDAVAESHALASTVADTEGVIYVPALLGLGAPDWDHGARGTLLGITRGTTAAHITRAVLEGVANRGADLVGAAEADAGHRLETLRVDGAMSTNPTFMQALAEAVYRPVEVSPVSEATTLGAGYLAGVAVGTWGDLAETSSLWSPTETVTPDSDQAAHEDRRARWCEAVERSKGWHEDLSSLDF